MRVKNSQQNVNARNQERRDGVLALWWYNKLLIFFCLFGLGLSLYAYIVELSLERDRNYKPYCDINSHMSCSKAFNSPYGKGLGIFGKNTLLYKPNSFYGIMFYSIVGTFSLANSPVAVNGSLLLIILANFSSLYFAYILYFILKDLCLVCISTYLVNVMMLLLVTKKHKMVRRLNELRLDAKEQKAKEE